jgi:hypothetical protein
MFLLVVVLPVHVSFGRCIACPCFFWCRQYNDQKKKGQAIQLPKETWTGNTTTKRNMDRQYNDQKKHGQTIQRPTETWTGFFWSLYCLSMFLLVFVLPVHVSFGRCIACPFFFWSLYCNDQKKHGQAIQRPKETWTDNTTTKRNMDRQYNNQKKHARNMDRQYNYQKKHGQTIQRPKETWTGNTTTKRNMHRQYNDQKKHGQAIQRLVVVLSVHVSFGRYIACPCFF